MKTWGHNTYGQLGDGTKMDASTPVVVSGLGGPVTAIAAGGEHTVALMADSTVKAWGYDHYGQLGDGKSGVFPSAPVINVDNVPPMATADRPSGNYSGSVTVTLNCSSDDFSGCEGIYYTLDGSTPSWPASGATVTYSAPLTITGNTTLTFFARDRAGNSSPSLSRSYTVAPSSHLLTISFQGLGSGRVIVLSKPAGIDCIGSCSHDIPAGTMVTLSPTANYGSNFAGWTGCDHIAGNDCAVTMTDTKQVFPLFNLITDIKSQGTYFGAIATAYGSVPDGGEIRLKSTKFYETLDLNRPGTFILKGGYGSDFESILGLSIIDGTVSIREGKVVLGNIAIR